ncbi:hypothetical protein [Shimia sp. NS0008-38b]|uniref:hypothetical protein n=1 Tax=Shimia sp. NS0008-38b TaxID=3127653 RepID=UPI00333F57ED
MSRTNPWRGWNKTEAHECDGCGALLFYLTGERRNRRFFLLGLPMLLLCATIGGELAVNAKGLHHFHEARGHVEPNFLGFLIICALFVVPGQLALGRFEKVEIFDPAYGGI